MLVNCLFSLVVPRSPDYQGVGGSNSLGRLTRSRIPNSDQHERPTIAQ